MNSSFIEDSITQFLEKYGSVPPPWFIFPDTHPFDITWRMGNGETHIMIWETWWERQGYSEEERISYFQKWTPPPRWLEWMIGAIWDIIPLENDEIQFFPFFQRVQNLGFGTKEEFDEDISDPKWLK